MASQVSLNLDDVIRYTQESVLYFLSQHSKNTAIKRPEFIKTVLPDTSRKMQNEVLKNTKNALKRNYGLNILEIDENIKQYLLINEVEYNSEVPPYWSEIQRNQQAILLPILAVIFMNGGSIPEGELWTFMRELKLVTETSRIHEKFGDLDRLLKKDLVTQRYLIYEVVQHGVDDDHDKLFQFKWGIRAEHEVGKEKILRHVCQVFDCEMTDFAEQYAQVS